MWSPYDTTPGDSSAPTEKPARSLLPCPEDAPTPPSTTVFSLQGTAVASASSSSPHVAVTDATPPFRLQEPSPAQTLGVFAPSAASDDAGWDPLTSSHGSSETLGALHELMFRNADIAPNSSCSTLPKPLASTSRSSLGSQSALPLPVGAAALRNDMVDAGEALHVNTGFSKWASSSSDASLSLWSTAAGPAAAVSPLLSTGTAAATVPLRRQAASAPDLFDNPLRLFISNINFAQAHIHNVDSFLEVIQHSAYAPTLALANVDLHQLLRSDDHALAHAGIQSATARQGILFGAQCYLKHLLAVGASASTSARTTTAVAPNLAVSSSMSSTLAASPLQATAAPFHPASLEVAKLEEGILVEEHNLMGIMDTLSLEPSALSPASTVPTAATTATTATTADLFHSSHSLPLYPSPTAAAPTTSTTTSSITSTSTSASSSSPPCFGAPGIPLKSARVVMSSSAAAVNHSFSTPQKQQQYQYHVHPNLNHLHHTRSLVSPSVSVSSSPVFTAASPSSTSFDDPDYSVRTGRSESFTNVPPCSVDDYDEFADVVGRANRSRSFNGPPASSSLASLPAGRPRIHYPPRPLATAASTASMGSMSPGGDSRSSPYHPNTADSSCSPPMGRHGGGGGGRRRRRHSIAVVNHSMVAQQPDLRTWLRSLRLHKYTDVLEAANISFEGLCAMSDQEMHAAGITTQGARKRLHVAIEDYRRVAAEQQNLQKSREEAQSGQRQHHHHHHQQQQQQQQGGASQPQAQLQSQLQAQSQPAGFPYTQPATYAPPGLYPAPLPPTSAHLANPAIASILGHGRTSPSSQHHLLEPSRQRLRSAPDRFAHLRRAPPNPTSLQER